MVLVNGDDEDNDVDNEYMIEIKNIKNKISKMVKNRDILNVTTRKNAYDTKREHAKDAKSKSKDFIEEINVSVKNDNTMKNMRSETELNMKEYAKVLRAEVDFDIPKWRNGRWLSAFGYAIPPHDLTYIDVCDDGTNGVPTV